MTLAQLKPVVAGLGGGASIDAATGTVTGPTYAVGGNSYNNVGDALGNLDARSTTNALGIAGINRYFKTNGLNDGTDDASIASGATGAVAIGTSASAGGPNSIAMGNGARTDALYGYVMNAGAVAIGNGAYAANGTPAASRASVAMGNTATAYGAGSVALGDNAVASTATAGILYSGYGISIGTDASSANAGAAIGYLAKATGNSSVSLGIRSNAAGASAVAIGNSASATTDTAVALGSNSVASVANTVSVGSASIKRKIVNIASGVDANDAVNVSQLKSSADSVAAAIGGGSTAQADGTITAPTYSVGGTTVNNIGSAITNLDGRVTQNSTAITNLQTGVSEATRFFKADGSTAASEDAVASGLRASAMGAAASATNAMGLAIGFDASASIGDNAMAVGAGSRATGENAVALGAGSVADRDNTVSVGMGASIGNGSRQIVNVANGTENTDSVNVQQLKPVIAALGGGASFNALQGTVGAPTYNVAGGTFNNVGDALVGIDTAVTKNAGDIVSINNQFAGIADSLAGAVMYGTLADGSVDTGKVNFAGADGTQLRNVANGTDAKDAVNLGQLNSAIAGASAGDTRYFKADGKNDGSDDAQLASVGSVAIGAGSVASRDNTVSVGSAGNERTITNVAAGSEDTDAVNVSQLKAVQGQVGALDALAVKYDDASKGSITLGGANGTQIKNVAAGSDDTDAVNVAQLKASGLVGSDGSTLDAVVYDAGSDRGQVTFGGVAGTRLANVMAGAVGPLSMDAINGSQLWAVQQQVNQLGDRVTNVENGVVAPSPPMPINDAVVVKQDGLATSGSGVAAANGDNATAVGNGAQANADNSVALGQDSVADRANSVSVGSASNERQITNVAAGTERTDAANWGQVQDALQTANRYTDDRVNALGKKLGDYQRQANRGIAASSALVNVTPYIPGKTVLNAGVATYRGESAMGVGISRWNDTGRVNLNAGMSAARGDQPIFRVGVGIVLGD